MGEIADFKTFQDEVQEALLAVTRTTGKLSAEDLGFQRSLNRDVGPALDEQSERVLALANKLLKSAASIADLRVPSLQDVDDVDNDWRGVVDVVDSLLEKADTALYEYTGVIKRLDNTGADHVAPKPRKSTTLSNPLRTQNLVKPQLAFDVKPDNFDKAPWKPLLTMKSHATLSLEQSLNTITNEHDQEQYDYATFLPFASYPTEPVSPNDPPRNEVDEARKRRKRMNKLRARNRSIVSVSGNQEANIYFRYSHPYETEILHLQYPESVYTKREPIKYLPVQTTSAIWVDTEEGVLEMLEELKRANEIAVDLEHHDARSFVGLVSLMQISTRDQDWIVDTLKPWRHKLEVLNEVFTDPKIVKVFHGAYMDIVWLQRDLGLYVVGLFDTHYASRGLGYAGGSLAFLLKKFIDFDADKKYQLADWRIRPLPEEMFFYARSDTHFLLYIYDNMRNELIDRTNTQIPEENRLEIVLQKSKEVSLQRYERQLYNAESGKGPGGWYPLLIKNPGLVFNKEQFAAFRAVHEWRDKIAREDDDGIAFIMPNHVLFSISKHLPKDQIALFSVASPISHGVKSRASDLLDIIQKAQVNAQNGPSVMDVLRPDSVGATVKANLPHVATSKESTPLSSFPEVDETELRSNRSSFWGGAFGSSIWESPNPGNGNDDNIKLAIPFPAVASEIVTSASTPAAASPQLRTAEATTSPTPEVNQAFTLRRGPTSNGTAETPAKRRKIEKGSMDITPSASTPASNSISLSASSSSSSEDSEATAHRLRREEKRKAKAEKRALKQQQKLDAVEDEEVPFDYSAAPKVAELDKLKKEKRKKDKKGNKDGKGQKVEEEETAGWDPYKKSMDAGKGMRRVQSERTGRSGIFKN